MVVPHPDLPTLEQQRARLRGDLAAVGDFRRGSLSAAMRRCGKPTCACVDSAHPGHGPQHLLTKKVAGKTVTVHLKPGPELDKVTSEVANYRRFKQLVEQIVEVNEAICEARPVSPLADGALPPPEAEKGGSMRRPVSAESGRDPSTRRSRRSSPPR